MSAAASRSSHADFFNLLARLFIALLFALQLDGALAAGTLLLGDATVKTGKDQNAAGQAEAFKTTASVTGTVASITIYVDTNSSATKLSVGLYAANGTHPGALLTQGTLNAPVAGAWNEVAVPAASVTAGTVYWIAVLSPNGTGILRFRDTSQGTAGSSETSASGTLTSLPGTWATGKAFNNAPLSGYASAASGPVLSLSATTMTFSGTVNGTNPAPGSFNVTNAGTGTLAFTTQSDAAWLTATPASGSAPQSVQVSTNITGLAAGTYTGHVTVTATGAQGSPATVTVTLTVSPQATPVLSVTPTSISFSATANGANPAPSSFNVTNTGTGTLSFTAQSDASWLTATPASGAAPQSVQVAANIAGLTAGTYTGHVTVTSTGATGSPTTVTVTLTVNPAAAPVLSVTPTSVAFNAVVNGSNPPAASLSVTNTGTGALSFTAASDATWLTVTPASGSAPATLTLNAASSALAAGTYTGHITITATGASGSPASIPVTLTVTASGGLLFGVQTVGGTADSDGAGIAEAFKTTASASGTLSSISVYIDSGSAATNVKVGLYSANGTHPGTLLTQGTISTPTPGTWNTASVTNVSVVAGTTYWIAVLGPAGTGTLRFRDVGGSNPSSSETSSQTTLTTLPTTWTTGAIFSDAPLSAYGSAALGPVLSVTPSTLSFSGTAGGANPAPASLTVSNAGSGTISYTATSNQTWLTVTPTSGSAPATLTVTASLAGLLPGTYTGQITTTASGATGSPATTTVTLQVGGVPAKLALTPATASTHTGIAVSYQATIQDASGNTLSTATNPVTFSVSGVTGTFNPASPVTPVNGIATSSFTPSATGTATITASATGLTSATASLTVNNDDVTTYHYDSLRTGWNPVSPTLTPASVKAPNFGLLHTVALDEQVDAQPLVVTNQAIANQGTHNVVYVATENNTVYAIDAANGTILLQNHLGTPVPFTALPGQCDNNAPNVGINSTPVIDRASNTMYVITYTFEANLPVFRLHALDLTTLADKQTPVVITASHKLSDGTFFTFQPRTSRQRSALVLANGNVYAGFASFCDIEHNNSRGWLLGWNATTLAPLPNAQLNDTQALSPNGFYLSSIWMSGYGVSADAQGNLYFLTGNSDYSGTTYDGVTNIQESAVKMAPDLSQVLSLFTPSGATLGWSALDIADNDFSSGGIMLLPDQPGAHPRLAVAAGKAGQMYLMDRDNLGGYNATGDKVLGSWAVGACWCGPSYYTGSDGIGRVVMSAGQTVSTWRVTTSPTTTLTFEAQSNLLSTGQDGGFFTAVSTDGANPNTGIIWAVSRPLNSSPAQVSLYAFNATPTNGVLTTLFSAVAGTWPNVGGNSNIVPVVANGYVYVASNKQLSIFGLAGTGVQAPAASPQSVAAHSRGTKATLHARTGLMLLALGSAPVSDAFAGYGQTGDDVVPFLLAATDVPAPTLPAGVTRLTGRIVAIEGNTLTLEARGGRTITVDLTEAMRSSKSVVPVPGRVVVVTGRFAASGVLHADEMLRAKASEELWRQDEGPQ
jgi:hypothetical protein